VGRTRIEHLERQLNQSLQRRGKLRQERGALSADTLQSEIGEIGRAAQQADQTREQRQSELEHVLRELDTHRDEDQRLAKNLHSLRSSLEDHRGRLASLDALQQAALGKSRAQVTKWLKAKKLADNPRLAELITVAPGWERAVETVLGYHLEAVCVEELAGQAVDFASLAGGSLSFVEKAGSQGTAAAGSLLSKITSPVPLDGWLGQVRVADDLEAASGMCPKLAAGESVITREGVWLGRHWLRVIRDQDERAGVIAREQELKQHKTELAGAERKLAEQSGQQEAVRRQIKDFELRREELQTEVNRMHRQQSDTLAQLKTAQGKLDQIAQRIGRLDTEMGELDAQITTSEAEIKAARGQMQAALDGMHTLETRRSSLQGEREVLREQVEEVRDGAKRDSEAMHAIALKLESQRALRESTQQNLSRMQTQLAQMENRRTGLQQAMQNAVAPAQQQETEIKALLEKRTGMDKELAEARRHLESIAEQVRVLEQQRHASERKAEELREQVQQLRLGTQEARVRRETLVEQLRDDGYILDDILKTLPENANGQEWSEKYINVNQRIERLGPINLAAIQEYTEQSERK
ncbi:MAG: chromosome segregation protein SMC, partial [Gammaproteobacteria bacterium]